MQSSAPDARSAAAIQLDTISKGKPTSQSVSRDQMEDEGKELNSAAAAIIITDKNTISGKAHNE
jgi:hypothetical protein